MTLWVSDFVENVTEFGSHSLDPTGFNRLAIAGPQVDEVTHGDHWNPYGNPHIFARHRMQSAEIDMASQNTTYKRGQHAPARHS